MQRNQRRSNDAIAQLTADHERVRQLVQQYTKMAESDDADDERKKQLAERICQEVELHARLEEELFYPAARTALDADDLMDEAEVEHLSAKDLCRQIESMSPSDHGYDARVKVLGEYVEHHVQEEEKQMFPKVKRAKLDLVELGEQMSQRREQLQSEMSMQPFEAIATMLTLPIRAAAAAARAGAAMSRRGADAVKRGAREAAPQATRGGRSSSPPARKQRASASRGEEGTSSKRGTGSRSAGSPRASTRGAASKSGGARAEGGSARGATKQARATGAKATRTSGAGRASAAEGTRGGRKAAAGTARSTTGTRRSRTER